MRRTLVDRLVEQVAQEHALQRYAARAAGDAEAVAAHKTSMLPDVEAGRALELEALVGAVIELGRIAGVPTPTIEAIYAATRLLEQRFTAEHGRLALQRA